jgi:hypothetical protein
MVKLNKQPLFTVFLNEDIFRFCSSTACFFDSHLMRNDRQIARAAVIDSYKRKANANGWKESSTMEWRTIIGEAIGTIVLVVSIGAVVYDVKQMGQKRGC